MLRKKNCFIFNSMPIYEEKNLNNKFRPPQAEF